MIPSIKVKSKVIHTNTKNFGKHLYLSLGNPTTVKLLSNANN